MAKNKHIVNASGGTINDEDFLKAEIASGVSFENPDYIRLFEHTLNEVLRHIDFATFCDIGTGIGVFPHVIARSGRDAVGYDLNAQHERYFKKNGDVGVSFRVADFTKGIVGKYDLLSCIEVAEHIPDEKLLPFLATLHNHGKALLFSSTSERTENDAAWGHINMKDQSEWVRLFASFGWELKSAMRNPNNWTKLFIYTGGK